jgi:capsule polysaccharide export protein KpsE/RkpR
MNTSIYLPKYLSSRRSGIRHTVMLLSSTVLIMSCASAPEAPVGQIQAAEQAIAAAERIKASDYALPELLEARADLVSARTAIQNKEMLVARRYAELSQAGAELASARAGEGKARAVIEDMQKNIDVLKQEMQRKTGQMQ